MPSSPIQAAALSFWMKSSFPWKIFSAFCRSSSVGSPTTISGSSIDLADRLMDSPVPMPLGLGSALSIRTLGTLCLNAVSPPASLGSPSVCSFRAEGDRLESCRADSRDSLLRLGTLLDFDTTGEGDLARPSGGGPGLRPLSRGSDCGTLRCRTGLPSLSLSSWRKDLGGDSTGRLAGCRLGVAIGRGPVDSGSTLRMTAFGLGS